MASEQALLSASDYPLNLPLVGFRSHKTALQKFKDTFNSIEKDLCHPSGHAEIAVPIRDLYGGPEKEIRKCNIKNEQQLQEWLGTETEKDIDEDGLLVAVQRPQPRCRFIYLFGETSRSRLRVSRSMMTEIFTFHSVMPTYLDFVFVFGRQEEARDLNFSGFREHMSLSTHKNIQDHQIKAFQDKPLPVVQDSHYQMCFNLKGATFKTNTWKRQREAMQLEDDIGDELPELEHEWTIRQVAIYHRFNVVTGETLWILTKGGTDLQQRFKDLTSRNSLPAGNSFDTPLECLRSSLAAHVMHCQWSTEDWRDFLRWLEDVIEEKSAMAVLGPRDKGTAHRKYFPSDIQDIQAWKDRVSKVTMSLKTNIAVIQALRRFYERLSRHRAFPLGEEGKSCIEEFFTDLDEILGAHEINLMRSELLEGLIQDRKKLILQHLQGQATERMEQLSQSMERETIVMRIITSVTLFYLPATFVSTFFSTDVVKYQLSSGDNDTDGSFSRTALNRWLQVTIPLTVLTICASWLAYRLAEQAQNKLKLKEQSEAAGTPGKWSDRVHKARNRAASWKGTIRDKDIV